MKWRGIFPRRSLLKFLALFAACLTLVVACGVPQPTPTDSATNATGAPPEATTGARVTMGTTLKARTLDPADAYEIFPLILLQNMGDRLYTYQPGTTELTPQLATALPTVSSDGLTYTIPLRSGVTFHDGSPFNAEAMAFSIRRFMENGGRPAYLLAEKIASVEATGEQELTIKLKSPFAAFPALLSFSGMTPVPPQSYEVGAGKFKPNTFVGTGPYKLAVFTPDAIKLDINEQYWGEKPVNQGIDIQLFTSPANLYNTFRTGGLDVAYQTLDPDQIASLEREAATGGWQVVTAGTTVINYLSLNQKMKPLDDVRVRQAIAAMVDRNLINQRTFQGQAVPLYSTLPTGFESYQPVFQEMYGDANYAKAKELLTAAGFSESNPFTLEVWYPSASTTRQLVANTMKAAIEENLPGLVTVDVKNVEGATLFENVGKGLYPSVLQNWYPDFFDPDNFLHPFLGCDKGSVATGCEEGGSQADGTFYYSEKANDLIRKQRAEQDPAARNAVFKDLQSLVATDVPYIPLWQNKDYVFAKAGLEGVTIQPTQQFLLWQIRK